MKHIGDVLPKPGKSAGDETRDELPGAPSLERSEACPICGGLGYISYDVPPGHPLFGRAIPCACQTERQAAEFRQRIQAAGPLRALQDKRFENFLPDGLGLPPDQARSLRRAYERARAFAEDPQGWLVLRGGTGCGKTHLAAAIAHRLLERRVAALFIPVPDLLDELRAAFHPEAEVSYEERFWQLREAPVLILDDLGAQQSTPWAQEKLFQLLDWRYNARLPTVITTNLSLEAFEPRLRSRLQDARLVEIVHILAPDFRRGGPTAGPDLNLLPLLQEMTFETFRERPELSPRERDNLREAIRIARAYAEHPHGWLVLFGRYGAGKTHLAAAIANAVAARGTPVLFVAVPDLLDWLRPTLRRGQARPLPGPGRPGAGERHPVGPGEAVSAAQLPLPGEAAHGDHHGHPPGSAGEAGSAHRLPTER
jgi:DNA replication protein DnaC